MTKLVAIFMLTVFSFNLGGYQILYNYIARRSDALLEKTLDLNNYNEEELVMIKQPVNLPYYSNSREFQRIDGEVEMDGIRYKYVKCRIYNDSLEMLCIPNKCKMIIERSKNEYTRAAFDFQQDDPHKKTGLQSTYSKKSLGDYEEQNPSMFTCGLKFLSNNYILVNSVFAQSLFFTTMEHPPEVIMA